MKKVAAILALCFLGTTCALGKMKRSISKEETVELMKKVCDYQIANPWKCEPWQHNDWERSTFYVGVMATYRTTRDRKYLDHALHWAGENKWAPGPEQEPSANRMTCGQTYLELYFLKKDPKMIAAMKGFVDQRMANPVQGGVEWFYCDSLFVAPPTLSRLGAATGDERYLQYMHQMYWDVTDLLLDKEAGLFYRDKTFLSQRTKNGKKVFWSRGNGWVIAGIPRILEYLPKNDPQRDRYIRLLKQMAASIAKLQGSDGLWRTSLLDPHEFPAPETSGSSFFCYALAWGLNHGYLEREKYLPVVGRAWKGLVNSVQPSGKLGWVQGVNKQPGPVAPEDTQEYGVGAFLLAASEVAKLTR